MDAAWDTQVFDGVAATAACEFGDNAALAGSSASGAFSAGSPLSGPFASARSVSAGVCGPGSCTDLAGSAQLIRGSRNPFDIAAAGMRVGSAFRAGTLIGAGAVPESIGAGAVP